VVDADDIARTITSADTDITKQIIDIFGVAILNPEGELDRKQLRQIVFADDAKRSKLESIIHPAVQKEILRQVSCCQSSYCVVSVPLLFETNMQDLVDRVLVVDTSAELQIERSMHRDKTDEDVIHLLWQHKLTGHHVFPGRLTQYKMNQVSKGWMNRLSPSIRNIWNWQKTGIDIPSL